VISTSQILEFLKCPLSFKVKYVLKAPSPEPPSPALEKGSRVHGAIADGTTLEDAEEQAMVERARAWLATAPPDPIHETTYEDRNNPGRFFGDLLGTTRAIGIFDVHWNEPAMAVDWKTGGFKPKYVRQ